jgi:hypothetical protein
MTKHLTCTLLAFSFLHAAEPVDRVSVSKTPGGSVRVVALSPTGVPRFWENPAREHRWLETQAPPGAQLPKDAAVLGLTGGQVRAYAPGPDGLSEYHLSRPNGAWTREPIDPAITAGSPCPVYSGDQTYVFARQPETARGLVVLRRSADGWAHLAETESAFNATSAADLACGATADSMPAIAVTTADGGLRVAVVSPSAAESDISDLKDAAGLSPDVQGRAAIASNDISSDIFAVSRSGGLLHWNRSSTGQAWTFEQVTPAGVSALDRSPSAVWHEDRMYVAVNTRDGKIAVLSNSASQNWQAENVPAPANQPVLDHPLLVSQPDELYMLGVLQSGQIVRFQHDAAGWTAAPFEPSVADAGSAAGLRPALSNGLPVQPTPKPSPAPLPAPPSAQALVDSIPPLVPAPATPPTVTGTTHVYSTVQGVRFDQVSQTTARSEQFDSVVSTNPNSDVLFLGSLVKGNSLASGILDPIPLKRSPLTLTVTDVAGSGPLSRTIPSPDLASVTTGVRDLLTGLGPAQTTAAIVYEMGEGESAEDALLDVGVSVKWLSNSVKASLTSTQSTKSHTIVVKLLQRYYTVSVNPPASAAAMISPDVSVSDAQRFIGTGNPPAYVATVTYGRMLFYVFESTSSIDKLKAALDATFNILSVSGQVNITSDQQQTLNSSNIRMFAFGGSASDAVKLVTGDFKSALVDYLRAGANFSAASPGVLLTYQTRFLKDCGLARINVATQWTLSASYALDDSGVFTVANGKGSAQGIRHTGFFVRPGDKLKIQASGEIWSGVWFTGGNDPRGWTTWSKPSQAGFPNMQVSPFCLLYQVGSMPTPLFAGTGFEQDYNGPSGELTLLINTNNYGVGSGQFTVNVTIQRQN